MLFRSRDKSWDTFRNDLMSRRAPAALVVIVATPWHPDGIQGRIDQEVKRTPFFPQFEVIRFPARTARADGGWDYLFEERMGRDWYESQYETLTPYEAAGLLDCNPVPMQGNHARKEWFRVIQPGECPELVRRGRWWDTAATKKKTSDYTAGVRGGMTASGQFVIENIIYQRMMAGEVPDEIKNVAKADGVAVAVWLEREPGSQGPIACAMMARHLAGYAVQVALTGGKSKIVRNTPLFTSAKCGNVMIIDGPWREEFMRQVDTFAGGDEKNDMIDAAAGLYGGLNGTVDVDTIGGALAGVSW